MCLLLLFSVVFANVSGYSTKMEILLYLVSICLSKQILNSFSHNQFSRLSSGILSRGKEII